MFYKFLCLHQTVVKICIYNNFAFPTEDVFSQSDMAKTLAEITKIDPSFNKDNFLHECEYEIIPTVLQVIILSWVFICSVFNKSSQTFYIWWCLGIYQWRYGTFTRLVS